MKFMTIGVLGSIENAPGDDELTAALRGSIEQIANDAGVDLSNVTVRAHARNLRLGTFIARITEQLSMCFESIFDRFSQQREQDQILGSDRLLYVDGGNERRRIDVLRIANDARKILYVVDVAQHRAA